MTTRKSPPNLASNPTLLPTLSRIYGPMPGLRECVGRNWLVTAKGREENKLPNISSCNQEIISLNDRDRSRRSHYWPTEEKAIRVSRFWLQLQAEPEITNGHPSVAPPSPSSRPTDEAVIAMTAPWWHRHQWMSCPFIHPPGVEVFVWHNAYLTHCDTANQWQTKYIAN